MRAVSSTVYILHKLIFLCRVNGVLLYVRTCYMVSTPQVIEMVGGLADRPIIRTIFDSKLPTLVAMCGQEIDEVKVIFDRYIYTYMGTSCT